MDSLYPELARGGALIVAIVVIALTVVNGTLIYRLREYKASISADQTHDSMKFQAEEVKYSKMLDWMGKLHDKSINVFREVEHERTVGILKQFGELSKELAAIGKHQSEILERTDSFIAEYRNRNDFLAEQISKTQSDIGGLLKQMAILAETNKEQAMQLIQLATSRGE